MKLADVTAKTTTAGATAGKASARVSGQLKRFAAEGKPVFVVEYPSRKDAETVRDEIKAQGFTGLVAGRELDRLP